MAATLKRIADSTRFQTAILGLIVLNAITLGLQTFPAIDREAGSLLDTLDNVFLGIFCVEIALRVGAYGARPWNYFRDGWNVFDFVAVGAAFIPGLRGDATLLRLVRLLRVIRLLSIMPDLRVLIRGMVSSFGPIASLAGLSILIMYLYGMVGWIAFSETDPGHWGTIAEAMLSLFVIMTLESWPDIMGSVSDVHPWAWIYFVSYVLIASFLVINVVIAIIINAVEDSREEEARIKARAEAEAVRASLDGRLDEKDVVAIEQRITALRGALEDLEHELGAGRETPQRRSRSVASKGRLRP